MTMLVTALRAAMLATLLGLGTLGLVGCEEQGPFEDAGEEVDEAGEEMQDEMEETGDEID